MPARTLPEERSRSIPQKTNAASSIPRREQHNGIPLAYAQQRLWFLDQLFPNAPLYNFPVAVRLRGPLNHEALQYSLDSIVARHESLRTTFASSDGNPVQIIGGPSPMELPLIELPELAQRSQSDRDAEIQAILTTEARKPFNLSKGLMIRGLLLKLGETEHILQITMHHIASDGWSLGVFFREMAAYYEGFIE